MPTLQTKLKSTRFLAELRKRANSFRNQGYVFTPKLIAPDAVRWWYWLEFGTGARGEVGRASGHPYMIYPVTAKALSFEIDGKKIVADHVNHPGIRPRAFVRKVMPSIHDVTKNMVLAALMSNGFRFSTMKSVLKENVMPAAKELIVASLAQEAPGENPNGRLHGSTAAEVFDAETKIVD